MSDAANTPQPKSRELAAAAGDPPNEDPIYRLLASVAREDMSVTNDDPRWARLAAGELDQAEAAELEALAASSEEARFLYQACQPLGQDFQARMVAAIEAQRKAEQAEESGATVPVVLPFAPRPVKTSVRPWWRFDGVTWWRPATFGAGLVTLAAASMILVMRPVVMAPLPPYKIADVQITTGERGATGEPTPAITLCAKCGFAFTLTPETTVDAKVDALFYALPAEGGAALSVPVESAAYASGVFRVKLAAGHGLAPGDYQLLALIGAPADLADPQALLAEVAAGQDHGRTWYSVRTSLRIE